jgi:hypothetical protein
LLDPNNQLLRLQVLFDDTMNVTLNVTRKQIGLAGKGKAKFSDINGRVLCLPTLIFPFRRALYWKSLYQYNEAMISARPHRCAELSNPDWELIRRTCVSNSDCGESLLFATLLSHFTDSSDEDFTEKTVV